MSQSLTSESTSMPEEGVCKAILEQGAKKGNQCDRPAMQDGYCGKHRKQAKIESATASGERKCSTHRCTNTFVTTETKTLQYCATCKQNKDGRLSNTQLCSWEEKECKSQAKESGYCGKHEPRALILIEAKKKGVRICDDARRACKNQTENFKLKCEECLSTIRARDNTTYHIRKAENVCTMCGVELETHTTGIRGHQVQKCSKCYLLSRQVEDGRNIIVSYPMKNKLYPESHYRQVIKSAADRGLQIDISFEQFTKIVGMPCAYCKIYNEHESIGIDRVDSNKGYTTDNIVPCCAICNMCKGSLDLVTFKAHILKLAREFEKEDAADAVAAIQNVSQSSYMRPAKIVVLYVKDKLDEYIQLCKTDNRSPSFIAKLEELNAISPRLSSTEFKRNLTNAIFSDTRAKLLTESNDRKRIPRKDLFGYMNAGNTSGLVNLYERTFGKTEGLHEDIHELEQKWKSLSETSQKEELEKVLIRYQNKRAAAAYQNRKGVNKST